MEVFRHASEKELRAWRRNLGKGVERAVVTGHTEGATPASEIDAASGGAVMTVDKTKPRSAAETYQAALDWQIKYQRHDRDSLAAMIRFLRATQPGLIPPNMSDEEAVTFLEERTREMVEESVKRVYHARKQEKQLVHYVGGIGGNSR